jgi:hypothetical protein
MKNRRWLPLLFLSVALCAAGKSFAVTYVVLPLIGDQITIAGARVAGGNSQDVNVEPLKDGVLDAGANRFVKAAIIKAQPTVLVVSKSADDPEIYALREKLMEPDQATVDKLLDVMQDQLENFKLARLVLVVPNRAETELRAGNTTVPAGKLAGLGYYIDRATATPQGKGSVTGFLGAFANFRVVVIDVSSKKILAQETATANTTVVAAKPADAHPWTALNAQAKNRAIEGLLQKEIDRMIPVLLQATGS